MGRSVLRNAQWERIAPLLAGKPGDSGGSAAGNLPFLEAVFWIAAPAPWRDLPEVPWHSLFRRFRRPTVNSVFECAIIDGNIARLPQHGTGADED